MTYYTGNAAELPTFDAAAWAQQHGLPVSDYLTVFPGDVALEIVPLVDPQGWFFCATWNGGAIGGPGYIPPKAYYNAVASEPGARLRRALEACGCVLPQPILVCV